jgi:hypothetical protein
VHTPSHHTNSPLPASINLRACCLCARFVRRHASRRRWRRASSRCARRQRGGSPARLRSARWRFPCQHRAARDCATTVAGDDCSCACRSFLYRALSGPLSDEATFSRLRVAAAAYSFSSLVVRHSLPLPPQAVAADTGACAGVRKREVFGALGGLLAGILLVLVVSGDVPLAHLLTPLGARPLPQLAVPHTIPVPPSPAGVLPALRQLERGHLAAVRKPPCRRLLFLFPSRSARSSRRQPCATCRHCSAGAAAAGGAIAGAAAASSRCPCAVTCRCSAAAARARGTAAS